jgi:hypothetical protein
MPIVKVDGVVPDDGVTESQFPVDEAAAVNATGGEATEVN